MKTTGKPAERGIALFVSIFALLLLSAVAIGLMYLADTETNINYNYRASQQAAAAASAGLQEVRERMTLINVAPHLITGPAAAPSTAAAGSVMYVLNVPPGLAVDPTNAGNDFFDTELCQENFLGLGLANPGPGVRCATAPVGAGWADLSLRSDAPYANTANALSWRWVRISWKLNSSTAPGSFPAVASYVNGSNLIGTRYTPVCWDGMREFVMPAGLARCEQPDPGSTLAPMRSQVYMLTSLAVTQTGARRMVQMEVAQNPPIRTNAAVDSQDHVTLSGQLNVNGYDNCNCQCTTKKVGGKDVVTCTDRPGMVCDKTKYAIYSSGSVDRPGASETIVAGTGTPEGSQPIAESQPWPFDINGLIDTYKSLSSAVDATSPCVPGGPNPCGWTCPAGDCATHSSASLGVRPAFPPTPPDAPADDPTLGPQKPQITYIPGSVHLTSSAQGNGILIVDGDLDINGGLEFYGLILVKGVISFTGGGADKTNIYGSVLAGQESRVDTVLGGSAVINFDGCALPKQDKSQPPTMIISRELSY